MTLAREEVLSMARDSDARVYASGGSIFATPEKLEEFANSIYQLGIAEGERRDRAKAVPDYVLSLVRFMCKTWREIDKWAYENCDGDALIKYPVIQGTSNQIKLVRISEQPFSNDDLHKAVNYLLPEAAIRARGDG